MKYVQHLLTPERTFLVGTTVMMIGALIAKCSMIAGMMVMLVGLVIGALAFVKLHLTAVSKRPERAAVVMISIGLATGVIASLGIFNAAL